MKDKFSGDNRQVVDLGANAGYTVRLWRELFPGARLITVEPDSGNMHVCRLNAGSIPGVRFDFVEACVDGKSGSVWLDRSEAEHQFHMTDGPSQQAGIGLRIFGEKFNSNHAGKCRAVGRSCRGAASRDR